MVQGAAGAAGRSPSRCRTTCPAGRGRSPATRGRTGGGRSSGGAPGRDLWGAQRFRVFVGGKVAGETTGRSLRARPRRAQAAAQVPGDRDRRARPARRASRARTRALRQPSGRSSRVRIGGKRRARARRCRSSSSASGRQGLAACARCGCATATRSARSSSARALQRAARATAGARSRSRCAVVRRRRQPPDQEGQAPHHVRLRAGRRELELGGPPLLMGVVNASPDSFSDARATIPTWLARAAEPASPRGRRIARRGRRVGGRRPARRSRSPRRSTRVVPLDRARSPPARRAHLRRHLQARGGRGRDRGGRGDGQRRLGAARPAARRGVRPHGRGAGAHAHARGAEGHAAATRTPTTTSWRTCVGVPRASGWRSRSRRGRRAGADRARPGARLRQDAGADGRGAAAARPAARRSGARCCWRSRARTSSARSPAAGRASAGRRRSPRSTSASAPGAAILRVHDVAAAADFLAVRAVLSRRARARTGRRSDARSLPLRGQVAGRCLNAAGCRPTHTEGRHHVIRT